MTAQDTRELRLYNQRISHSVDIKPEDIVKWMGAMQAQDYGGAKWAIGLRSKHISEVAIEKAINDGRILRTHMMRPTWHFVTSEDIRWMLELTSPRVHAVNAPYHRKLGLDANIFKMSNKAIITALFGGKQMTRSELVEVLNKAQVPTVGLRHIFLIMHAELEGIICSGARRGKQFTYMLLDERVPTSNFLEREEALGELAKRYFISHGPATIKDYIWWSGLSLADAKVGIKIAKKNLSHVTENKVTYWFSSEKEIIHEKVTSSYLLPNYDEYIVGYTDRGAIFDVSHRSKLDARANPLFQNTIIVDGSIIGTWKRDNKKGKCIMHTKLFRKVTELEENSITEGIGSYEEFLEVPVEQIQH